ncbi:MAG: CBS domain-containing protein [Rhodospirillales bacterium]
MTEHTHATVGDVMTRSVRTIGGMATVQEAIEMMRGAGVSSLVVDRRDRNDEFGLLVISDIAGEVIGEDRAPERVNVYEVMSKPVLTLPADMNIRYAIRLLLKFGLSRALVTNEDRTPAGIVTLRDMVLGHAGDEPAA